MNTNTNDQRIELLKARLKDLKRKLAFCDDNKFKLLFLAYTTSQNELALRESEQYRKVL